MNQIKTYRRNVRDTTIRVVLLAFASLCTACSTSSKQADSKINFSFQMYARDATGAEEFYRVDRDGTISFGGGLDARLENTSWTGKLSSDEIRSIREQLDSLHWLREKPASTGTLKDQFCRIVVHSDVGRRRVTIKGKSEAIEPMRVLLQTISLRRLDEDLKRLPKPGSQNQ